MYCYFLKLKVFNLKVLNTWLFNFTRCIGLCIALCVNLSTTPTCLTRISMLLTLLMSEFTAEITHLYT